jgi:hypothetical protein
MDNPEKQETLDTKHRTKINQNKNTQHRKIKKDEEHGPHKKGCSRKISIPVFDKTPTDFVIVQSGKSLVGENIYICT